MGFGFSFGGDKSKSSYTDVQSIDPKLRGMQEANFASAQGNLPQTYTPTSPGLIQSYMSPYVSNVVNGSLGALNTMREMALNGNKEAAIGAGAFSSYDGRALADSLTNQDYFKQAGLLSSQLYNQGYGQALGAAQQENQYGYQYPLDRQGLLNQTLAGITPTVTRTGSEKRSGTSWKFGFSGGSPGGTGGPTGGTTTTTGDNVAGHIMQSIGIPG